MLLQTRNAHMKGKSTNINGTVYEIGQDLCIEIEDETNIQKALAVGWTDEIIETKGSKMKRGKPAVPPPSLQSAKAFVELVAKQPKLQAQCEECQTFSELLKDVAQAHGYNFNVDQLNQARTAYVNRNSDVRPHEASPQHAKLAREASAVKATERTPVDEDEMSSPFGSYSKKVLKAVSKELGIPEADLLMAAYKEDPKEVYGEDDFKVAAATLLPQGAVAGHDNPDANPDTVPNPDAGDDNTEAEAAAAAAAKEAEEAAAAKAALMEALEASGWDTAPFEESGEWPEPNEDMPIDFLKKMADGYEVKYGGTIGAGSLVERILKAMYPDG